MIDTIQLRPKLGLRLQTEPEETFRVTLKDHKPP